MLKGNTKNKNPEKPWKKYELKYAGCECKNVFGFFAFRIFER